MALAYLACYDLAATGSQQAVITLTAETAFYQLLWTTCQALGTRLLTLHIQYREKLQTLSEDITLSAKPRSSFSSFHPHTSTSDPNDIRLPSFKQNKSDLYAWREIFQLYTELSPFERLSEVNRGERTVEEAETLLKSFAERIAQTGLADKPKMKLTRSRASLERFLELNRFILNMKKVSGLVYPFPTPHTKTNQFFSSSFSMWRLHEKF